MVIQRITRDERGGDLLEVLLVFGVVTILAIRGFLALTGYPQLGGGSLHIAHMLWGGLGMLVAIGLLLNFWNVAMRQLGAAVGGIGFGFFIDELGKFITSDNDYFFQPTIALLYVLFILLFVVVRIVHSRPLSAEETVANKAIITAMSGGGGSSHVYRVYALAQKRLSDGYRRLVSERWFAPGLSAVFIVVAIGQLVTIVTIVTGLGDRTPDRNIPLIEHGASAVSGLFILLGVMRLPKSRLSAYRWFQRSTLVTIFVTQVFMFYYSELAALGGLLVHLMLYMALRILITREEEIVPGVPG